MNSVTIHTEMMILIRELRDPRNYVRPFRRRNASRTAAASGERAPVADVAHFTSSGLRTDPYTTYYRALQYIPGTRRPRTTLGHSLVKNRPAPIAGTP